MNGKMIRAQCVAPSYSPLPPSESADKDEATVADLLYGYKQYGTRVKAPMHVHVWCESTVNDSTFSPW